MTRLMTIVAGILVSTASIALPTVIASPNPSAIYCVMHGGSYETRSDSNGAQAGVCMFNQQGLMSECGGWAYLRGECEAGSCAHWSVDMDDCETVMSAASSDR